MADGKGGSEGDGASKNLALELRDSKKFTAWLKTRSREECVAIAARAALRVAPTLGTLVRKGKISAKRRTDILLPVLRCMAAPWAAAKYPARGAALRPAAAIAAAATAATDAATAATDAAFAASAAASAAAFAFAAASAADAAFAAASAASAAAAAVSAAATDAAFIAGGGSVADLIAQPLWPQGEPDWSRRLWQGLKAALPPNEHWDVWTRWWEARRDGGPAVEALEIFRVVGDPAKGEKFWKQAPAAINTAIWDEEEKWRSLRPRPSPHDYHVVNGKLDVAPESAVSIDAETTQDLHAEAQRKVRELQVRIRRAQVDERVRGNLELLRKRLAQETLRPGLVLSSLRSLESDMRAYDTEEGRKELASDLLAGMFDVTETLRALAATFPKSREIEAEAVALDMPMERLDEIERNAEAARETITASDEATGAAKASLDEGAASIANARTLAERSKQVAYHLLDLANFGRAGLRYLKSTGQKIAASPAGKEVGGLAGDVWKEVRKELPKRAGRAISIGVVTGVGGLIYGIGPAIGALAGLLSIFIPIKHSIDSETNTDADQASAEAEGEDARASARTTKPTRAKATKKPARKRPAKT